MSKKPRRTNIELANLINVTIGCWLFLSPFFLLHFEEMTSSLNAYFTGAGIAIVAAHARDEFHFIGQVIAGLLAIWLIVSPWALGFAALTATGTISAVVTGLAVLALAVWSVRTDPGTPAPEVA